MSDWQAPLPVEHFPVMYNSPQPAHTEALCPAASHHHSPARNRANECSRSHPVTMASLSSVGTLLEVTGITLFCLFLNFFGFSPHSCSKGHSSSPQPEESSPPIQMLTLNLPFLCVLNPLQGYVPKCISLSNKLNLFPDTVWRKAGKIYWFKKKLCNLF